MSNHTPGPWEYHAYFSECYEQGEELNIYAGDVKIISGCGCCGSPTIRNEADARLIATAPELLEACKKLITGWQSDTDTLQVAIDAARAAIAKAEGEVKP